MLKVIKGGLDPNNNRYSFKFAETTDTRLMGVIVVHIVWEDKLNPAEDFHQFFYYDAEEYGLDHIDLYRGNNREELEDVASLAFAGLGARLNEISENEALWLVQSFVKSSKEMGCEEPKELEECRFVLNQEAALSPAAQKALDKKICTPIETDYGVIHYYIMRCVGGDYRYADILKTADSDAERIEAPKGSTYLYGKIEETAPHTYKVKTLVESDGKYKLRFFEFRLYRKRVLHAKQVNEMAISYIEASVLLDKQEFTLVYDTYPEDEKEELLLMSEYVYAMHHTIHPNGVCCVRFNDDNSHVEMAEYKMANDVASSIVYTENNQIIISADTQDGVNLEEMRMIDAGVLDRCFLSGRYHSEHAMLLDFLESEYSIFDDFIEAYSINNPEE